MDIGQKMKLTFQVLHKIIQIDFITRVPAYTTTQLNRANNSTRKIGMLKRRWEGPTDSVVQENEISTSLLLGVDFKTYGKMAREQVQPWLATNAQWYTNAKGTNFMAQVQYCFRHVSQMLSI